MKHVVKISIAMILLIQSMAFSQTSEPVTASKANDAITNVESTEKEIVTNSYKAFLGSYYLSEASITLTIIEEKGNYYLTSPGSKDVLFPTNETTLTEIKRGVNLELIEGDSDGLKFTQNGYETVIKRVKPETQD